MTFQQATKWYRALGGNSANVAIGLARLGEHVRLVGKIGNDLPGLFLRENLEKERVDCSHLLVDANAPTAQCYMTMTYAGEHDYYNWPSPHAADLLRSDEVNIATLLVDTIAVHTTAISLAQEPRRSAVKDVIKAMSASGAIISFDAGLPRNSDLQRHTMDVMSQAHILKMNEPEVRGWSQLITDPHKKCNGAQPAIDGFEELTEDLLETLALAQSVFERIKPVALLVTLSARGSLVITAKAVIFCGPHKVEAASEVGAGDAYVAGVLSAITSQCKIRRSNELVQLSAEDWRFIGINGNVTGAMAATHPSACAGMPTSEQLSAILGQVGKHDGLVPGL